MVIIVKQSPAMGFSQILRFKNVILESSMGLTLKTAKGHKLLLKLQQRKESQQPQVLYVK